MANEQNLIPASDPNGHKLTVEEQSAGGIASGEARRRRKTLKELKFRVWSEITKSYHNCEDWLVKNLMVSTSRSENVVEQYTGLKDKNGKEIYEGDIVRCYSRKKLLGEYQVIWNEDCGGFECESLKPLVDGGDSMLRDVRVFNEMFIQFRVISNIHENGDLLFSGGEE